MDFVDQSTLHRIENCISGVISTLARNMLECDKSIRIQGLLAVTVDEKKVALVHVNETAIGPPRENVEYVSIRKSESSDNAVTKMIIPEVIISSSTEKPKRKSKKWRDAHYLNGSGSEMLSDELNKARLGNDEGVQGMLTKEPERYDCKPCKRTFRNRLQLKNHERQCRYSTSDEEALNTPMRTTLNNPNVRYCKICNKYFDSLTSYSKHFYEHANAKLTKSLSCGECGRSFQNLRLLDEHIMYFHRSHEMKCDDDLSFNFHCEKCDEAFSTEESYHNHLDECPLCSNCEVESN